MAVTPPGFCPGDADPPAHPAPPADERGGARLCPPQQRNAVTHADAQREEEPGGLCACQRNYKGGCWMTSEQTVQVCLEPFTVSLRFAGGLSQSFQVAERVQWIGKMKYVCTM